MSAKVTAQIGLIAGVYTALTIIFAPISYGPIQVRVAEILTVLPYVYFPAIPGLFVGCIIANTVGGLGLWDIGLGSIATLIAAFLTHQMPHPFLAPLPPVLINALIVGSYLSLLFNVPLWLSVLYVGVGQIVACYLMGYPFLIVMIKMKQKGYLFIWKE